MNLQLLAGNILLTLLLANHISNSQSDESPGFFLKITKNVPRLGKRDESYFAKGIKSIPRIGRAAHSDVSNMLAWLWNTQELVAQPGKRRLGPALGTAATTTTERELSVVQPVNSNTLIELLDRDAIPSEHVKFVHWKDFDRALLSDSELYAKVISLGRKPDQRLKQDISLTSFVPIFGNSNDAGNGDFMLYNNKDNDLYNSGPYSNDFLQYNHLR